MMSLSARITLRISEVRAVDDVIQCASYGIEPAIRKRSGSDLSA